MFFFTFGLPYYVYAFQNPDLDSKNPKACWVQQNSTVCNSKADPTHKAENMTEKYMEILQWGFYLTAI